MKTDRSPYEYPSNQIPSWLGWTAVYVLRAVVGMMDAADWLLRLPRELHGMWWDWLCKQDAQPEWKDLE